MAAHPTPARPQQEVEDFLFPEPRALAERLQGSMGPRFAALNRAMGALLDEFSLVSFVPLDVTDEDRCGRAGRRVCARCTACTLHPRAQRAASLLASAVCVCALLASTERDAACSVTQEADRAPGQARASVTRPVDPGAPFAAPLLAHSIAEVLYNIDTAIQYGEDAEVKMRDFEEGQGGDEEEDGGDMDGDDGVMGGGGAAWRRAAGGGGTLGDILEGDEG